MPRLRGWSEQVGETVNVSESIFSETLSRKRRRLAGGGEWTEWSSAEQSWDEEEQTPESSKDWGSDKDLEEEEEEENGEEAWRDVRQLEDADILAVLSELINEELADEDERREEKKKANKETQIDVARAKKRRKGGRKRKKERTEEQVKSEGDRQMEESREREAELDEFRKLEALQKRENEKKTEREIEKRQREGDREKRQRAAKKESDEWQELANEGDDIEEVSKRQSSLGPLRGGPRSSSRLKKVILQNNMEVKVVLGFDPNGAALG